MKKFFKNPCVYKKEHKLVTGKIEKNRCVGIIFSSRRKGTMLS